MAPRSLSTTMQHLESKTGTHAPSSDRLSASSGCQEHTDLLKREREKFPWPNFAAAQRSKTHL